MKLTIGTKIMLGVVIAGIAYLVLSHFNMLPSAVVQESVVPRSVEIASDAPVAAPAGDVAAVPLPSAKPAAVKGQSIRINVWEWNAQMGLFFANGGPQTTSGSLAEKHGLNVRINRQDVTDTSMAEQVKLASLMSSGDANPSEGVHFVIIMGDQSAQYLAAIDKQLDRLGKEYRAEIVGAIGYSRGEDGWWGPQEWKDNPQSVKGKGTAGVLREGDWNITLYKLANDGVKNNPDPTTWDMDAHNWFAAGDYLKAVEMYVAGHCEDRDIVAAGRKTGEKHHACVEGVTTWTPGDVNLAKQKGGLVRLLSTAENVYQMPAVLIGIKKWDVEHSKQVTELLAAALEGGEQVKHHDAALSRAGQASFAIYADQSAAYWVRYYKGVTERDKTNVPVPLGGSTVMNLGDNLVLFGLAEGSGGLSNSVFKASYEGFGNLVVQQYPSLMSGFPPIAEAVNLSYLQALAARMLPGESAPEVEKFTESGPIQRENVVAQRNWNIQFATGQATFAPESERTLTSLYDQLLVGAALSVEVQGHTDNVGNADANRALSERRAFAVKEWLERKNPTLFPANRLAVRAFGDTAPLAPNSTPEGRAQNRRVTIILGTRN